MNKNKKTLRLFLAPLLAIVMLAAAISVSGSYNSSQFPEMDTAAVSVVPVSPVSVTDVEPLVSESDGGGLTVTIIPVTPSDSAPSGSDADGIFDANSIPDADTASVSVPDTAVTSAPADNDVSSATVTVGDTGARGNAAHVKDPDYDNDMYIVVYTGSQNVLIYEKGSDGKFNELVKCFICSSGKKGHSTRLGMYNIIRRYRWRLLVGDVYGQYSTGFSSSYLFHSVPYLEENDPSTLDMDEYEKLGSPASKGCIRLCVRDAKWIYENCPDGTQINIVDDYSDEQGAPILPIIDEKKFAGWDPSDPDPDSPYNTEAVG